MDTGRSVPRLVVTRGGDPSPAQVAAVALALTASRGAASGPTPSGWRRAALREATGAPVVSSLVGLAHRPGW